MQRVYRTILVVGLLASTGAWAHDRNKPKHHHNPKPGGVQFTPIAQDGDTIDGHVVIAFNPSLALTDNGEILYGVTFADGGAGFISSVHGLVLKIGDLLDGEVLQGASGSVAASNDGEVVFSCAFSGGITGICNFTQQILRSGETFAGLTVFNPRGASINNNGAIVFLANYIGGVGVFTTTQGRVAASGTVIAGGTLQPADGQYDH